MGAVAVVSYYSCLSRFHNGACSRLQFLRAVSHSVGAPTGSLQPRVDNSSGGNNLGRLLQSVHGSASCWLRTGAVRT